MRPLKRLCAARQGRKCHSVCLCVCVVCPREDSSSHAGGRESSPQRGGGDLAPRCSASSKSGGSGVQGRAPPAARGAAPAREKAGRGPVGTVARGRSRAGRTVGAFRPRSRPPSTPRSSAPVLTQALVVYPTLTHILRSPSPASPSLAPAFPASLQSRALPSSLISPPLQGLCLSLSRPPFRSGSVSRASALRAPAPPAGPTRPSRPLFRPRLRVSARTGASLARSGPSRRPARASRVGEGGWRGRGGSGAGGFGVLPRARSAICRGCLPSCLRAGSRGAKYHKMRRQTRAGWAALTQVRRHRLGREGGGRGPHHARPPPRRGPQHLARQPMWGGGTSSRDPWLGLSPAVQGGCC